ncbi:hypothetical protein [Neotabrizicola shimadae]|uniref:Uncharacterized protein n=1 Tax=Neotabrizicola shimadae TaxID=2807096 RepID=A0A8G1EDB3_9RHOB|nr:hypothetical protein [Neotabrizicola shimadae]QYZ69988.1 hypothetical protein JO391_00125 [Neotabrizicola shimadae]
MGAGPSCLALSAGSRPGKGARAVYAAVGGEARRAYAGIVFAPDPMVIACQEQLPFNSLEGFAAYNARLRRPRQTLSDKADSSIYGMCELLPPAPRPEFLTPVSGDIPTMVV